MYSFCYSILRAAAQSPLLPSTIAIGNGVVFLLIAYWTKILSQLFRDFIESFVAAAEGILEAFDMLLRKGVMLDNVENLLFLQGQA